MSFIVLNVLIGMACCCVFVDVQLLIGWLCCTAVMVENFSLFYSSEEAALLSHHDLKGFLAKWNVMDRDRKVSFGLLERKDQWNVHCCL